MAIRRTNDLGKDLQTIKLFRMLSKDILIPGESTCGVAMGSVADIFRECP
jgi:hypothetical protein